MYTESDLKFINGKVEMMVQVYLSGCPLDTTLSQIQRIRQDLVNIGVDLITTRFIVEYGVVSLLYYRNPTEIEIEERKKYLEDKKQKDYRTYLRLKDQFEKE